MSRSVCCGNARLFLQHTSDMSNVKLKFFMHCLKAMEALSIMIEEVRLWR